MPTLEELLKANIAALNANTQAVQQLTEHIGGAVGEPPAPEPRPRPAAKAQSKPDPRAVSGDPEAEALLQDEAAARGAPLEAPEPEFRTPPPSAATVDSETKRQIAALTAVSKDDVVNKLLELADQAGDAKAKGILKSFGAKRVRDLKEEQYADVVRAAMEALRDAA